LKTELALLSKDEAGGRSKREGGREHEVLSESMEHEQGQFRWKDWCISAGQLPSNRNTCSPPFYT
jgi:hypothetical protein